MGSKLYKTACDLKQRKYKLCLGAEQEFPAKSRIAADALFSTSFMGYYTYRL